MSCVAAEALVLDAGLSWLVYHRGAECRDGGGLPEANGGSVDVGSSKIEPYAATIYERLSNIPRLRSAALRLSPYIKHFVPPSRSDDVRKIVQ